MMKNLLKNIPLKENNEEKVNNSKFIKNVGLDQNSSVGTVSCMNAGSSEYDAVITNTIFEENKGSVAGFGEHGTLAKVKMDNVVFEKNEGKIDILIYQGNSTLQNIALFISHF